MKQLFSITFATLIFAYSPFGITEKLLSIHDWEKVNESDGVTVYTSETETSQIVKVKTQVLIEASLAEIQKILDDVNGRVNWVPFLNESRILQKLSPTEKMEYSIFYGPWPASNRDFVYRITLFKKNEHQVTYSMISEPSNLMPEQNEMVRAQLIESYYTLTALDNGKTNVELIFHADPKGWVPIWIVNIIQRVLPYMILKNLKELAEGAPAL